MPTQTRRMAEAGGQRSGDAAGAGRVWRDGASSRGRSGVGKTPCRRGLTLAIVLVCLLAMPASAPVEAVLGAASAAAPAAPGDEYWAAGFASPSANNNILALVGGPDGSLYAGVAPLRWWNYADVAAPYEPLVGKPLDSYACTQQGPDGAMDLVLHFDAETVVAAIGDRADGNTLLLTLTGNL